MIAPLHYRNVFKARLLKLLSGRRFARWGVGSWIVSPSAINNPENIRLGDDVFVASGTCLSATPQERNADCLLAIGSGSRVGHYNHIVATREIVLEDKVLTANNVYISDNLHEYSDPDTPIMDQPLKQLKPVRIGKGTWLGHGACVMGASIGRNCVIGSGAVVTKDIPDYSVAVGAPARIIRRFDCAANKWVPVETAPSRDTKPKEAGRPT